MMDIEVKGVVLQFGGTEVVLTVEEVRKLRSELARLDEGSWQWSPWYSPQPVPWNSGMTLTSTATSGYAHIDMSGSKDAG